MAAKNSRMAWSGVPLSSGWKRIVSHSSKAGPAAGKDSVTRISSSGVKYSRKSCSSCVDATAVMKSWISVSETCSGSDCGPLGRDCVSSDLV